MGGIYYRRIDFVGANGRSPLQDIIIFYVVIDMILPSSNVFFNVGRVDLPNWIILRRIAGLGRDAMHSVSTNRVA